MTKWNYSGIFFLEPFFDNIASSNPKSSVVEVSVGDIDHSFNEFSKHFTNIKKHS